MVEINCPWCEAKLQCNFTDETEVQTCPECLTAWAYEEVPASTLPVAA